MRARQIAWVFGVALLGCADDGEAETDADELPECVTYELTGCSALYPPTYDQVWTQTFANGCAGVGGACHGQDDAAGAVHGLTFLDPQTTWDHLRMDGPDGPLVIPGDPQCSPLFVRLAIDDPELRMPPGAAPLSPTTLCSIGTWIDDGAAFSEP